VSVLPAESKSEKFGATFGEPESAFGDPAGAAQPNIIANSNEHVANGTTPLKNQR